MNRRLIITRDHEFRKKAPNFEITKFVDQKCENVGIRADVFSSKSNVFTSDSLRFHTFSKQIPRWNFPQVFQLFQTLPEFQVQVAALSLWQPGRCFLCVSRLSSKAIRLCSLKAVMAFLWPMTFSVIILEACVKVEKWILSPCFARATTCWLIRLLPGSTIYIFVTSWIR